MAGPTFVSSLVAGRNTGVLEMTQANASVGASQLNCGSSGTVSIVALVARPGTNTTSSAAIDYVRVGGIDLTASEAIRTLGGFGTGTMRAFAGEGLALSGNQNWAVGQNAGDSWGWEVTFLVFDGDTTITYSAQADVLINNGDTHTKSITSNANSTIVEAFYTTYNTTVWTGASGSTVVQSNAFVLGDGVGVYGPGSTGSVSCSPNATEIIIGGAWNLEAPSSGTTLTADHGTLTINGQAVALSQSRSVVNGLINFNGQDVTFTVTNPGQTVITLEPGTINFSSPEAYSALALSIEPGTIVFNGQTIEGTVTGPITYTILVEPGRVNFNGRPVNLIWSGAPITNLAGTNLSISMRIGL